MKTKPTAYIAFILTALSVTNCTIEKRLFQPGYSVEWKKKIPQKDLAETINRISENRTASDSAVTNPSSDDFILNTEKPLQEKLTENNIPENKITTLSGISSVHIGKEEIVSASPQKKSIDQVETEDKKELEIFGVMSFGLYLCCVILSLLGVFVFNLPIYLFVIAGFMILLSLIFGIISVDKYRRNRSRYYQNFFGYFGLIASAITISVVAIFLILVIE